VTESAEGAGMTLRRELVDRLGLSSGGAAAGPAGGDLELLVRLPLPRWTSDSLRPAEARSDAMDAAWRSCLAGPDGDVTPLRWRPARLAGLEAGTVELPPLELDVVTAAERPGPGDDD